MKSVRQSLVLVVKNMQKLLNCSLKLSSFFIFGDDETHNHLQADLIYLICIGCKYGHCLSACFFYHLADSILSNSLPL